MSEQLRLHHEEQELSGEPLEANELELIKKIQELGKLATEIGLDQD